MVVIVIKIAEFTILLIKFARNAMKVAPKLKIRAFGIVCISRVHLLKLQIPATTSDKVCSLDQGSNISESELHPANMRKNSLPRQKGPRIAKMQMALSH